MLGKNLTIECPASGRPPPTISWYKNNHVVTNEDTRILDAIIYDTDNDEMMMSGGHGDDTAALISEPFLAGGIYITADSFSRHEASSDFYRYAADDSRLLRRTGSRERSDIPVRADEEYEDEESVSYATIGTLPLPTRPTPLGADVVARDDRLNVVTATEDDSGHYTCVASSISGDIQKDFYVQVLGII
ncbi:PREDICTED: hemicentin-1-like [Priapulus caudatus]|uniref:Hemicentin-1-like n=1 Tax=Priapulus caudatus TaxID=37621 RepID=A0ABM1EXL2_PRICU|nr:PREDICTED: hemicentin-1-like [Priapulus caudatus]